MTNEKPKFKIEKITHLQLAQSGISSKTLGLVFQQYEEKYGKGNVSIDNEGICIAIEVKPEPEQGQSLEYLI